jgi:methionine synthase I (cobalamin-dependent)
MSRGRGTKFLEKVGSGFVIGDGAYGFMLQMLGLAGTNPAQANLAHPDEVLKLHRGFVAAGAEVLETNTFQAHRMALDREGMADKVRAINEQAVRLARTATSEAGREIFVAGDIGPSPVLIEPYGDLPVDKAREGFREQAAVLAQSGVDFLILQTFSSLEEMQVAIEAARETGLPVAASMAFQANGRTTFGVTPDQAAARLAEFGAGIVGANCSVGPQELLPVARAFRTATSLPVLIQPNAGLPELRGDKLVYPVTPQQMAEYAVQFRDMGINYIGACCGSTPDHIRAIAHALRTSV